MECKKELIIEVNPTIFSVACIMRALSTFSDDFYIEVDGDPIEKILVRLIPKKKEENLENTRLEFNTQLVISYVENS